VNAVEIDSVLIDAIAAFVRERVSGETGAQAESLARQYYRWVPAEDLERREPADLAGAAIATPAIDLSLSTASRFSVLESWRVASASAAC